MTDRIEKLLFARRRLVLAAFVLATLAMGWIATGLRIDAGFTKLVPVEHEYMQTFLQYREEFGGADRVVIAVMARDGDMFTPEFFTALREVTDATFFLPGVDRAQVFSILTPNVRYIEVVEDGIAAGNVLPADFEPTETGFARVRENIIKAGIVGRLVANDFTGAIVAAKLQEFHPNTGERLDYIDVAHELERIRREAGADSNVDVHVDLHVIGFAKMVGDIAAGAIRIMTFFGDRAPDHRAVRVRLHPVDPVDPAAAGVLAGRGGVAARRTHRARLRRRSDVHPGAVPGIRDRGQPRGADGELGPRGGGRRGKRPRRRAGKLSPPAAAGRSGARLGLGGLHHHLVHRSAGHQGDRGNREPGGRRDHFHQSGTAAVLLSWFEPDDEQRRAARAHDLLLQPMWSRIARVARRGPAAVVIAVSLVLLAAGAHFALQVRVGDEHRGVPELRADSVYNLDSAVITDRFEIGVDVLSVIAETEKDGCIDFEVMSTLDDFEWRMRNVEGVQSVLGLAGVARNINASWNEGNLKWRALPRNRYSLVQTVSPVPTSSGLLNLDCSVMPVSIYTADHKAETIERVVDAVKEFNAANRNERIAFRLASGNVGVMAATNEEVEASQFPILAYVYGAVIVLCLLSFRSISATVCIIVPLAVVSLLAYALMALLQIGLKVSTLPVVALGVGIGVDYGIYIYGRLRTYLEQGLDFATAYERTLATTGAGVVLTGLTLAAGVATWIVAPLKFQADMGTVLTFMFLVNMVGAVVLLPALGAWLVRPGQAQRP